MTRHESEVDSLESHLMLHANDSEKNLLEKGK